MNTIDRIISQATIYSKHRKLYLVEVFHYNRKSELIKEEFRVLSTSKEEAKSDIPDKVFPKCNSFYFGKVTILSTFKK